MTKEELENQIDNISNSSNIDNIKDTINTEIKIAEQYDRQARRIAGTLMASGGVEDLNKINYVIEEAKNKLDKTVTDAVTKRVDRSLKAGINNTRSQITLYKDILPRDVVASDVQPYVFNQVWFEASELLKILQDGMTVSNRIWDINQTALDQLRIMMMDGMLTGKDFAELYQQIKSFLILPDVDLRTKKWKEFFKDNPPGRGVYRSAYKNVMRLLRTETNRAFRLATIHYAKGRSWVYGIRFMLSEAHPEYDICDSIANADEYGLGPGVYPPEAVPEVPHPHCLCYLIMIPKSEFLL